MENENRYYKTKNAENLSQWHKRERHYVVYDCPWNKKNYPDIIGQFFTSKNIPSYAMVREVLLDEK